MVVLPLTYWGSIEHFAHLRQGGEGAVIDLGENYVKRSERNRTEIVTPTGGMVLSVPLIKANRPRTPMRDMRIDNTKRWQHQHWVSILSAYKSSPYFDYFADDIEPFYRREWQFLVDYNREYLQVLLKLLGSKCEVKYPEQYVVAAEGDLDLRPKNKNGFTFVSEPYFQVFSDRMPFQANLSILDLVMCEGPSAIDAVLMRCQL